MVFVKEGLKGLINFQMTANWQNISMLFFGPSESDYTCKL